MKRSPERLEEQEFDLVVIGGGINGAGIARDAALRGLRVALIDKGDFASGTSSRSSKLLHGGIRYLEQFRFRLVREALHERGVILQIAPLVTRPLDFLVPVYRGDPRGKTRIRLGLALYDHLAGSARIGRSRFMPPVDAIKLEPSVQRKGLRGIGCYRDAVMDDARLCLLNILDACRAGAVCLNYVAATGFIEVNGLIGGARAVDLLGQKQLNIRGRVVINAGGPWADAIACLDPRQPKERMLRPTKGVHIVVPVRLDRHALLLSARRDKRVLFVIPWGRVSIIGTTDTDFDGDPDLVSADQEEVDYLLEEVRGVLPLPVLDRSNVLFTYAGVRPLVRSAAARPWQASREHRIVEHHSGLITVLGGKYTTYRAVAQEVVDKAVRKAGLSPRGPCRTATVRLPGNDIDDYKSYVADRAAFWREKLPGIEQHVAFLVSRYGTESEKILQLVQEDRRLMQPIVETAPNILAEIIHAQINEMAVTLEDVLRRRLGLSLLGIRRETVESRIEIFCPWLTFPSSRDR